PHVEGSPLPVAEAKIKEAKLVPKIVEQFDSKLDIGMVISQDPRPPMRAKENSTVILYVSKGKQKGKMPDLIGQSREVAEQTLK
ncbi:PASTA domain-containing protein, partial [Frankia sp. Cpl3]|nr:PASTA domain-containing protein [Frankia sp. Cpl3]